MFECRTKTFLNMITLRDFIGLIPEKQKFIVRICNFNNTGYKSLNYDIIEEFNFDDGLPVELPLQVNKYLDWYIDYVYSEKNGYIRDESYIFLLIFDFGHGRNM